MSAEKSYTYTVRCVTANGKKFASGYDSKGFTATTSPIPPVIFDKTSVTIDKGKTYTKETTETPQEFINIINVLTSLSDIEVEICGTWIWVSGNTKAHKEMLKELKFRYAHKKQAWYYHTEPYRKRSKRELTLDEIRDMFDSEKYNQSENKTPTLHS